MSKFSRRIHDLHDLPKVRDGWTFLYVDRVRIERADGGIDLLDEEGRTLVPVALLSTLILGPGTTVTHGAIAAIAESGCSIVWVGEDGTRFYGSALGETHRSANIQAQAAAWADAHEHLEVVLRLYRMRFGGDLTPGLRLEQLRGLEGVRVREAYARISRETGIKWAGRNYRRGDWGAADPINRALSAANACLYALCHAAIVATGFSPALGFIHTGRMLSFVYDIADLYKLDVCVPVAFSAVRASEVDIESRVRRGCRVAFHEARLLERILPDIQGALGLRPETVKQLRYGLPETQVSDLWDPREGAIDGGQNLAPIEPPPDDEEVPF